MRNAFIGLFNGFSVAYLLASGSVLIAEPVCVQALLDTRYAPYVDWRQSIRLDAMPEPEPLRAWWRTPEQVKAARKPTDLPLSGLHLALDPGHIGGAWAADEGRHFRISDADYAIREGELVLEVALLVRDSLAKLGAEVSLLRESCEPINPKPYDAYLREAMNRRAMPEETSLASLADYALQLRQDIIQSSVITGELLARARLVNQAIRPDALLSLHINAAPWPVGEDGTQLRQLVESNHVHVLIFGCMTEAEWSHSRQQQMLKTKLMNGSGPIEEDLADALGEAFEKFTGLKASEYAGRNAIRLEGRSPYVWARNLLLLRSVECPVVLLEPYVANSHAAYPRLQDALRRRVEGLEIAHDDILKEYSDAVVFALLELYGSESTDD